MTLKKEVADLILLSKSMIDRIRIQFNASPDSHTLAASVLLAHDSAELALAVNANQTGQLPTGSQRHRGALIADDLVIDGKSVDLSCRHKPHSLLFHARERWGGAGGGSRTPTGLALLDFESCASTRFTTPALN